MDHVGEDLEADRALPEFGGGDIDALHHANYLPRRDPSTHPIANVALFADDPRDGQEIEFRPELCQVS